MPEASLDVLLDHLKQSRGFDFTGYKRSTLQRRFAKRMEAVGAGSHAEYLDHLELNPDESGFLFNALLINVTAFFRDAAAWDFVAAVTIPKLLESVPENGPLRVWCAGCASGEETFTVAMLLAEALGDEEFQRRVKVYATDVDEEALREARHASYSAKAIEPVPAPLRDKYFDRVDQRYVFRKDLRRGVIFGHNDLAQDAPISRIDLLVCRNTLMYFNAETQARIVRRLHFALNDSGFLFLGKAEMLVRHTELFAPVNVKRRVFSKVVGPTARDRRPLTGPSVSADRSADGRALVREAALDAVPAAHVVLGRDGTLISANRRARALFNLAAHDLGRPLKDLEISYRPVDLRTSLELVLSERRGETLDAVPLKVDGEDRTFDVQFFPLQRQDDVLGAMVVFEDVTAGRQLAEDFANSKHDLESAYEELQSTVEELETTNEELHSTNEELETTNEELQSTNQELETMNEQLHSTNEELQTINEELHQRTLEVNEGNAFLEAILTSIAVAVVVVDRDFTVQVWNGRSAELWGPSPEDVEGQDLLELDIGLPVASLRDGLRSVLAGTEDRVEVTLPATNRRGGRIRCRVASVPLTIAGEITGAVLLMADAATAEAAEPVGSRS